MVVLGYLPLVAVPDHDMGGVMVMVHVEQHTAPNGVHLEGTHGGIILIFTSGLFP